MIDWKPNDRHEALAGLVVCAAALADSDPSLAMLVQLATKRALRVDRQPRKRVSEYALGVKDGREDGDKHRRLTDGFLHDCGYGAEYTRGYHQGQRDAGQPDRAVAA